MTKRPIKPHRPDDGSARAISDEDHIEDVALERIAMQEHALFAHMERFKPLFDFSRNCLTTLAIGTISALIIKAALAAPDFQTIVAAISTFILAAVLYFKLVHTVIAYCELLFWQRLKAIGWWHMVINHNIPGYVSLIIGSVFYLFFFGITYSIIYSASVIFRVGTPLK